MANRYFLAYLIVTSCTVAGQSPKYALKGLTVKLKPDITGQPDDILWKHNGNKVIEFDGKEEHEYSPYENRITLNWFSAELDITNLRYEDSGEYVLEAYVNKVLRSLTIQLEVIDKVVKPTISCEMNDGSTSDISGTQATLTCSAEPVQPQSLVKFEWRSHGNVQLGPKFAISLGDQHDDEVYSCGVSNPLTDETATFTAKDCYPDKSSSTALIATLVTLAIALLAMVLGIVFCKRHHKACFAKGKKADLEKQSPPHTRAGSGSQDDEDTSLLGRSPTVPSTQRLVPNDPASNHKEGADSDLDTEKACDAPPQKGHVKRFAQKFEQGIAGQTSPKQPTVFQNKPLSPINLASNNKGDPVADQHREPAKQKVKKANSVGALGDSSENTQSDLESSTAPEHPESENEADKELNSPPANVVSPPAAQPCSLLFPNMAPGDIAGEPEEDANSNQVTGETSDKSREADNGESSELDDSTEGKQSSTVPEQNGSETTLHKQDSRVSQDNHQEPDKPVSEDKNESDSVGDGEEKDQQENLYLADSQQPQSPTPRKPDISTFQVSPDTAHADTDPEEEDQTRRDSDYSVGQSGSSTADADNGTVAEKRKLFESLESKSEGLIRFRSKNVSTKKNDVSGSEREKALSPPASAETATAQPCSPLTKSSPNMAPKDTAGEHEEESDSYQDTEETVKESEGFTEEKQSSTVPEQNGSETSLHEQDSN